MLFYRVGFYPVLSILYFFTSYFLYSKLFILLWLHIFVILVLYSLFASEKNVWDSLTVYLVQLENLKKTQFFCRKSWPLRTSVPLCINKTIYNATFMFAGTWFGFVFRFLEHKERMNGSVGLYGFSMIESLIFIQKNIRNDTQHDKYYLFCCAQFLKVLNTHLTNKKKTR